MLTARTALRSCSRSLPRSLTSRRHSSSGSHHHDEHHHQDAEPSAYEGFVTPFWRNVVLISLAGAAFYKYAPEPNDDVYLTRWIALYTQPRDVCLDLNAKHTVLSQSSADASLLIRDAKKPVVHRFRYPLSLEQCSPFLTPIGLTVDMSNVAVKGDKDMF